VPTAGFLYLRSVYGTPNHFDDAIDVLEQILEAGIFVIRQNF
jgi:hypothetical protein